MTAFSWRRWANYETAISLATDAGNLAGTLQASPNAAGLAFSQVNLSLSPAPTVIAVHPTSQSASRGDAVIQVLDGANVLASFAVPFIEHPVVHK